MEFYNYIQMGERTINFFSFAALGSAAYFGFLTIRRLSVNKRDRQNNWAVVVLMCLGWWNVCDAFFYVAATKEAAWVWHRLGSLGWCGFISVTAYYFLVMTGADRRMRLPAKIIYWLIPAAFTLRFLAAAPTALAEDLVRSSSGWGWTYVQRFHTVWPFLFLAYLLVCLGGALFQLYRWQKTVETPSIRRLARGFVVLDSISVVIGFAAVFVIPYFTDFLPPAAFAATLTFGICYWNWLRDYDFVHVELALDPGYLLDSCIDAMLVADAENRILYVNSEAKRLLAEDPCEKRCLNYFAPESCLMLREFCASGRLKSAPMDLELKSGIPVLCTLSRMNSRDRRFSVCVYCMSETSQLKAAQERLDYLAHYDELTGLFNRRRLDELLEERKTAYECSGDDFEMLFLDLTSFKRINDTYGHAVGDKALSAAAKAIRASVPEEDVLARYAGDEFVILRRTDGPPGLEERLRRAVSAVDCGGFAPGLRLQIDVGACRYSEAGGIDALFKIADDKMYQDKRKNSP